MMYKSLLIVLLMVGGLTVASAANASVSPNGDEQKQPRYKYKTAGSSFTFFPFLSIEKIEIDTTSVAPAKEPVTREEKVTSFPFAF